jgi:hypothetical protein
LRLQGVDAGVGISGANGIAGGTQRCEKCRSTIAQPVRIIEHHIDEVLAVVQKRNGFSGALHIARGWCVSIYTGVLRPQAVSAIQTAACVVKLGNTTR